jgi:hypothetical protein
MTSVTVGAAEKVRRLAGAARARPRARRAQARPLACACGRRRKRAARAPGAARTRSSHALLGRAQSAIALTAKLGPPPYCCGEIDCSVRYTFDTRKALLGHHKLHTEKLLQCSQCLRAFVSQARLSSHKETHGPKRWKCSCRDLLYQQQKDAKRHVDKGNAKNDGVTHELQHVQT